MRPPVIDLLAALAYGLVGLVTVLLLGAPLPVAVLFAVVGGAVFGGLRALVRRTRGRARPARPPGPDA